MLLQKLSSNENSRALVFSPEDDTDNSTYRAIVWDGKHPNHSKE